MEVHADLSAEELVPDASYLPSADGWDGLTIEQAREKDPTFRRPLSNGHISPEARVYMERRNELLVPNQAAFRTVRRLRPEPGKPAVRLGNCYEFFKQMEFMAGYWDDTSLPPPSEDVMNEGKEEDKQGGAASTVPLPPGSPSVNTAGPSAISGAPESNTRSQPAPDTSTTATPSSSQAPERVTWRRQSGAEMPLEHRHNFLTAFVKLVSYDFGCNVGPSRVEPRLHLIAAPKPRSRSRPTSQSNPQSSGQAPENPPPPPIQKASYFPSGCVFVHRIPTTREAARAGIVEGPVAAVSARGTTIFDDDDAQDALLDLSRELIVALSTAQLRARERRTERRFGEGCWWATAKRWGGGEGGPIGREIEAAAKSAAAAAGDKESHALSHGPPLSPGVYSAPRGPTFSGLPPSAARSPPPPMPGISHPARLMSVLGQGNAGASTSSSGGGARPLPLPIPMRAGQLVGPAPKRQRKTPSIYDHYRMVRPPASNWDRKARYEAIGRVRGPGADCDDVFVFSSLFHHFSVVRVRVPDRLLDVLDGEAEAEDGASTWGKLEVRRSKWFDLFQVDDRVEAMRLLWGVMAWLMRRQQQQPLPSQSRPLSQQQHPPQPQQGGGGGGVGAALTRSEKKKKAHGHGADDPDVVMRDA